MDDEYTEAWYVCHKEPDAEDVWHVCRRCDGRMVLTVYPVPGYLTEMRAAFLAWQLTDLDKRAQQ